MPPETDQGHRCFPPTLTTLGRVRIHPDDDAQTTTALTENELAAVRRIAAAAVDQALEEMLEQERMLERVVPLGPPGSSGMVARMVTGFGNSLKEDGA